MTVSTLPAMAERATTQEAARPRARGHPRPQAYVRRAGPRIRRVTPRDGRARPPRERPRHRAGLRRDHRRRPDEGRRQARRGRVRSLSSGNNGNTQRSLRFGAVRTPLAESLQTGAFSERARTIGPSLQAGGRRFDPGTLHLKRPWKRGLSVYGAGAATSTRKRFASSRPGRRARSRASVRAGPGPLGSCRILKGEANAEADTGKRSGGLADRARLHGHDLLGMDPRQTGGRWSL